MQYLSHSAACRGFVLVGALALGCGGSSTKSEGVGGSGGAANGGTGSGLVSGTGGDGGSAGTTTPPSCPEFEPCGGDVVGTWVVAGTCVGGLEGFGALCEDGLEDVAYFSTGTLTFTETRMTSSVTARVTADVTIDAACAMGFGVTAEQLPLLCLSLGAGGDSGLSCSLAGAACACDFDVTVDPPADPVAYTIEGDEIVQEGGERAAYCVTGDLLRLESVEPTTGLSSIIELERQ